MGCGSWARCVPDCIRDVRNSVKHPLHLYSHLSRTLQEISTFIERLAATNFIKRLVYSNDIRADLQKFGTMLSDANERLKV